ncbi:thiamine phosphate synthase [Staphylococcus nepalensis]|uniref:thiamine phosphate synthase n=1 Tax=Staphylococcus nepalensis TaxID=214473 RepID=UPI0022FFEDDF|nr:thiamine phosphate synthase [Staphylococcus nepalensis]
MAFKYITRYFNVIFPAGKVTFFNEVRHIFIAITEFKFLNLDDILHYKKLENSIDFLIVRTPMSVYQLIEWINQLIQKGFSKNKIIIHSNTAILERCNLSAIHFKEDDERIENFKITHPNIQISISTHCSQSVKKAQKLNLDFVLFGHIFQTKSKPNKPPRTKSEINDVLKHRIPIIALGGVNELTLKYLEKGFDGVAGIEIFRRKNTKSVERLKKKWEEHQI